MKSLDIGLIKPKHFLLESDGSVAKVTLNRPEKKNPLTFESYQELTDFFRDLAYVDEIKTVVISGTGGNFSSGGDVNDIIGPLTKMSTKQLLGFTQMTGNLVKAMRHCPQPIISAIDGVCAGAGAIVAMASDMRIGTPQSKVAFLFVRVGLAGCDMGACAILPRIIGQGRASELLYTGRAIDGVEAERIGFYNSVTTADNVVAKAVELARQVSSGPTFAHGLTKKMLHVEWNMSVNSAIDAEAIAQALLMQGQDFRRAYNAFIKKERPVFAGE